MKVLVDDVWSSPSTLHVRVTVSADDGRWHQKYYEAIPLETIPEEALVDMLAYLMADVEVKENTDSPLF
jgi:hypothetical protein